jgi:hypothetical protein
MPADRGLAAWLRAIVGALEAADPVGAATLRGVAGRRSARIGLDAEWVAVRFDEHGALRLRTVDGPGAGPWGRSSRSTVVDVLAARVEVRDAVLAGDVEIVGSVAEVAAMVAIIEIVLDAAMRAPALQALADELVAAVGSPTGPARPPVPWYPDEIAPAELRLLRGLGLVADRPAAPG